MRLEALLRKGIAWAIAACLLFSGCEDRVAGTSTSVGTSIGGTALLPGGGPAVGALVKVRGDEIEFRSGNPQGKLIDSAMTDAQGRFSLHNLPAAEPATGAMFLEIATRKDADPQVFFSPVWEIRKTDASLGTLRLAPPGALQGNIQDTGIRSDSLIWIGIVGTDHFARVQLGKVSGTAALPFRLNGLFPGDYQLTVVSGSNQPPVNAKKEPVQVKSGSITDVGTFPF